MRALEIHPVIYTTTNQAIYIIFNHLTPELHRFYKTDKQALFTFPLSITVVAISHKQNFNAFGLSLGDKYKYKIWQNSRYWIKAFDTSNERSGNAHQDSQPERKGQLFLLISDEDTRKGEVGKDSTASALKHSSFWFCLNEVTVTSGLCHPSAY